MARLKPQAKVFLLIVGALAVVFGLRAAMQHGMIPTPGIMKSVTATRVELPAQTEAQVANVKALPYPTTAPANVAATRVPFDIWEWNAMFALIYANGGRETTKGSLMEKNGVNLVLHREDSNSQMKADLLACAKQLHDGEKNRRRNILIPLMDRVDSTHRKLVHRVRHDVAVPPQERR